MYTQFVYYRLFFSFLLRNFGFTSQKKEMEILRIKSENLLATDKESFLKQLRETRNEAVIREKKVSRFSISIL